jgi:hypothetical protein
MFPNLSDASFLQGVKVVDLTRFEAGPSGGAPSAENGRLSSLRSQQGRQIAELAEKNTCHR